MAQDRDGIRGGDQNTTDSAEESDGTTNTTSTTTQSNASFNSSLSASSSSASSSDSEEQEDEGVEEEEDDPETRLDKLGNQHAILGGQLSQLLRDKAAAEDVKKRLNDGLLRAKARIKAIEDKLGE